MALVFCASRGGMGTKDLLTGTSEFGYTMRNLVQHLFFSLTLGNVVHLGGKKGDILDCILNPRHFENEWTHYISKSFHLVLG